jgi:hypothetical protein
VVVLVFVASCFMFNVTAAFREINAVIIVRMLSVFYFL